MNQVLRTTLLLSTMLFFTLAFSQQKQIKVLVLYDMEGVTGVTSVKHTSFGTHPEYIAARQSLTADVNAAIAGLKSAGVTEIVIVDGHGSGNTTGPDVFEDQLLPPAKMIVRDKSFDIYMDSYDQSIDAIIAIGMHAGAGNEKGFISHTYTIQDVQYKINGVPFNESMILAAGASRYKIPLIMVSGDDQLSKEVERFLPWVKYATIKRAINRSEADPVAREEASRRIESAANNAIRSLSSVQIFTFPGPFRFALSFQNEAQARTAAMLQGAEPGNDVTTVQVRTNDFEEGYRKSLQLISLAGTVMRAQELQQVLNAQPNAKDLQNQYLDQIHNHWLTPLIPTVTTLPTQTRFWGAR
ncbi:MAG: M55 family metallopeptidase [bacterium]